MKAYSGTTSEGFLPAALPAAGTVAAAVAPAPEDPSATFADALDQQTPKGFTGWPPAAASEEPVPVSAPVAPDVPASPATAVLSPAVTFSVTAPLAWVAPVAAAAVSADASSFPTASGTATSSANVPFLAGATGGVPAFAPDEEPAPHLAWPGNPVPTAPASSATISDDANTSEAGSTQTARLGSIPLFNALARPASPAPPSISTTSAPAPAREEDALSLPSTLPAASTGDATPARTTAPAAAPRRAPTAYVSSASFAVRAASAFAQTSSSTAATVTARPTVSASSSFPTKPATPETATDSGAGATPSLPLNFAAVGWADPSFTPARGTPVPVSATPPNPPLAGADFTGASIVASLFGRAPTAPVSVTNAPSAASPAAVVPAPMTGSPLATIMAHAAILAASAKGGATDSAPSPAAATPALAASTTLASAASATPVNAFTAPSIKPTAGSPAVEKKSAASLSERSFLQESNPVAPPADMVASLLQAAVTGAANVSGNQTVTTSSSAPSSLSDRLATAPISTAGMANGKKVDDMNATPEMTSLVVSSGTHPLVTSTPADVHIALASNHDFSDALHQVMHVAELGNMSRTTPPLRVAIEIQTPPGAIVNVYVSRQADSSYRAQLSTSDPRALSWVQDQIGSLKDTTGSGSAIRWSPAQLETATSSLGTSSGSTGGDRQDAWDRGGQGQSGYQQDERPARRRPAYEAEEPEAAFETFSAVGGVA